MSALGIALLAAASMFLQDLLGVGLVQAEARNKANLAAIFDSLGYFAALATMAISINAVNGGSLSEKALVLGFVSVANYAGTYLGVRLGKRWIPDDAGPRVAPAPQARMPQR